MHGKGIKITKNHGGSRFLLSVRVKLSAWHKYPIQDHQSSSSNTKTSTSWIKLLAWRGLQGLKLSFSFISVINQLDAQNVCFTISFISCLYMFRAHVLIIRRSKLHYTASGIITLKQASGLKLLKYNSINMSK